MVRADTCNLTTARHKLDMNSGNFLKGKGSMMVAKR